MPWRPLRGYLGCLLAGDVSRVLAGLGTAAAQVSRLILH